ncbi:MAG TPA: carboxypeptidase regulatory-like domain-containing protein [Bryobacteraceae bacterium]|jgi:tetratricopeptide (TPR) repeat protein
MFAGLRRSLFLSSSILVLVSTAWAQTTTLEGDVKDDNGQPLKGAMIVLNRTDIKGHYQVKSDKHGHWLYTGLPSGNFDISCEVDGKVMDSVKGVHSSYGDNPPINFDLRKVKQSQQAAAQANASGELTKDQEHGMTKEQKEQFEAQAKKNAEINSKNKALNDAYNAATDSIKAAGAEPDKAQKAVKYQAAIDSLNKAGQLDANQAAIWDSLGEAYTGLGDTQTGDDRTKSYDAAIANYNKGLAIKPGDAGVYNQIGNLYGKERKIPEATEALTKAAQLDPTMAAKAYFNMGANLVNGGQPEKAADFFKKATDADPNYYEAWYQYGSLQMMQGKVDPKTGAQSYPPETAPALRKYLELQPNGVHAQEATAMLQAMGEKVETKITNPAATSKKKR